MLLKLQQVKRSELKKTTLPTKQPTGFSKQEVL